MACFLDHFSHYQLPKISTQVHAEHILFFASAFLIWLSTNISSFFKYRDHGSAGLEDEAIRRPGTAGVAGSSESPLGRELAEVHNTVASEH